MVGCFVVILLVAFALVRVEDLIRRDEQRDDLAGWGEDE